VYAAAAGWKRAASVAVAVPCFKSPSQPNVAVWRRGMCCTAACKHWADSSGHRNTVERGYCDGWKTAFRAIFAGQVAVTWSAWDSAARGTPALLVVDCSRPVERGGGGRRGCVFTGRSSLVSGGRRHATIGSCATDEVTKRALSDICRAGRDRVMAGAEPWRARDCQTTWTVSIDDIARAAPECRHTRRWTGVSSEHCAMAR
jgi:hypothetical protein